MQLQGIVKGNTVTIYDGDIAAWDGEDVSVTISRKRSEPTQAERDAAWADLEGIRTLSDKVIDCKEEMRQIREKRYEKTQTERDAAFEDLMKLSGRIDRDFDFKKELEEVREERYERYMRLN